MKCHKGILCAIASVVVLSVPLISPSNPKFKQFKLLNIYTKIKICLFSFYDITLNFFPPKKYCLTIYQYQTVMAHSVKC